MANAPTNGVHAKITVGQERLSVAPQGTRPYRERIENMPFWILLTALWVYAGIIFCIKKSMLVLVVFDVCTNESNTELGTEVGAWQG